MASRTLRPEREFYSSLGVDPGCVEDRHGRVRLTDEQVDLGAAEQETFRAALDEADQLKAQSGKDLIKYGTSRVDDTLLRARLVDELRLWVMPAVVGTGQRLFEDVDTSALKLTLTDVRRLANSSVILSYTPSYIT